MRSLVPMLKNAQSRASLYADGKVRHVGMMPELEEELVGFTTYGYQGAKSPNRGDAAIWAIYALFPHLTRRPEEKEVSEVEEVMWDSGAGY